MIGFRHADPRFPFLWEAPSQPPGRWHADGDGPAHYLAETPDGAWAEFLRHEGIDDPADIPTIRRAMWALEIPDEPMATPRLRASILRGGLGSYPACQQEATRLRRGGAIGLTAPSAALRPGAPSGWTVEGGMQPAVPRPERVIVLFGQRPDITGWAACAEGHPRPDLVAHVEPLTP